MNIAGWKNTTQSVCYRVSSVWCLVSDVEFVGQSGRKAEHHEIPMALIYIPD
jgi:hypothetical protein